MEDPKGVPKQSAQLESTWRVSLIGRVGLVAVGLGAVVLSIVSGAVDGMHGDDVLILLWWSAASGACMAGAFWTSLTLTGNAVIIRNLGWTRMVLLTSITRVHAGYSGVEIATSGRRRITAMAVQKANASVWFGRRTRADEVVTAIEQAVARANGERSR